MRGRHESARMYESPRAAWILARAFTSEGRWLGPLLRDHRTLTRLQAAIAWPVFFLMTIFPAAAGDLYLTPDGDGAAVFGPRFSARKATGYAALSLVLVLVGVPVVLAARLVSPVPAPVVVVILTVLLVMLVVVTDAMRGRRPARSDRQQGIGKGTRVPRGHRRWGLDMVGQLPGTRGSAFDLARDLIDAIPSTGDVVLITAATWKLHRIYRRTFTPTGRGRRLYRITPIPPPNKTLSSHSPRPRDH